MFPWIRDALGLVLACRSLRLARDARGVWRPAAAPADIEEAFAAIATALGKGGFGAWQDASRVEETERLRLAVQALVALALAKGVEPARISRTLEAILVEEMPSGDGEPPPVWSLVPAWAVKRARRRIARAGAPSGDVPRAEPPPPMLGASFPARPC